MPTPNAFVVTGTLSDEQTVALDEPLPMKGVKVRLLVEPLASSQQSYTEVMAAIRERQSLRGHQPPTREAVDTLVQAERESWGE